MENNPKKSKAFIITFILILILLVAGYYLFKNRNQIFDAKGTTSMSKIFSPLLGTSKNKDVKIIDDGTGNPNPSPVAPKKTGVVITDANGNRLVLAEAGEILKKGDVLYIAGFNKNNLPIVMKAIANDKKKSLVFGVAGEDMDKGALGHVIIEGILTGVPTNKKEGTLWAAKNPLYLSDKIYGGMTKNPPKAPSFVVPVGSVIKVDPINGSIRIGNLMANPDIDNSISKNIPAFNTSILNMPDIDVINGTPIDLRDYLGSIFDYDFGNIDFPEIRDPNQPDITPINPPDPNGGGGNGGNPNGPNNPDNPNGPNNPDGPDNTTCNDKEASNYGSREACNYTGTLCTTKTAINFNKKLPCVLQDNQVECVDKKASNYGKEEACKYLEINKCTFIDQNPLKFTTEEQSRLSELLRKFYLLAPKIKTVDDIESTYNEMAQYESFVQQINGLTNQCYEQKQGGYTYPTAEMGGDGSGFPWGNPWYKYDTRGTYVTDEEVGNNGQGFCYGKIKNKEVKLDPTKEKDFPEGLEARIPTDGKGQDCGLYKTPEMCITGATLSGNYNGQWEVRTDYLTGCQWMSMREYERLLNIW